MAWFGEGLSSLRGQLSTLAKNLVDEEESRPAQDRGPVPVGSSQSADATSVDSGWSEAEQGSFIGQEDEPKGDEGTPKRPSSRLSHSRWLGYLYPCIGFGLYHYVCETVRDEGEGNIIPKGIANLFHQIGGAASQHIANVRQTAGNRREAAVQTDPPDYSASSLLIAPPSSTQDSSRIAHLTQRNNELTSEVEHLRRLVRELESQVANSQDENANLSTGLEELDIQHQEAIERVLTVKDEALKELEQLKEEMKARDIQVSQLTRQNKSLLQQVDSLKLDLEGTETLAQENAELRNKLSELAPSHELPSIPEQSALEEHVRTLEAEVAALRESRDNLEHEQAALLAQLRQRDSSLRKVDAKLEEITREKEIKEREMTQIVFECNSLREELKEATLNSRSLEEEAAEAKSEATDLKERLSKAEERLESLESARQEADLARVECETLKAELASLKEDLGGEEAKALVESQHLQEARHSQKEADDKIKELNQLLATSKRKASEWEKRFEDAKGRGEAERQRLEKELDDLRNESRGLRVQADMLKQVESELKQQLAEATSQRSAASSHHEHEMLLVTARLADAEADKEALNKESQLNKNELAKLRNELSSMKQTNEAIKKELEAIKVNEEELLIEMSQKEDELTKLKSKYDLLQKETQKYQAVIKQLEVRMSDQEIELTKLNSPKKESNSELNLLKEQNEKQSMEIKTLVQSESDLRTHLCNVERDLEEALSDKNQLNELLENTSANNKSILKEKQNLENVNSTLLSELNTTRKKASDLESELSRLKEESVQKPTGQGELEDLHRQRDELKEELRKAVEMREELSRKVTEVTLDRDTLLSQLQALRSQLDADLRLKEELASLTQTVQERSSEVNRLQEEIKRLNSALSVQLSNNEALYKEKFELHQKYEQLHVDIQKKMAAMEGIESQKNKEIESLKLEVENLKTQLEYASHFLRDVERQEGEGQPSTDQNTQKTNESAEELNRLSAALLKEQTEKKLLQNQLSGTTERLEKAETQLKRLKSHLVEVEESYSSEVSAQEERLREMQAQLQAAEERARNSANAYTSASIRSNQAVESLRDQVRSLTETKERLEQQVSMAEDSAAKQSAAVTRLQTVLHHFQIDKQKDIDFETERIRRDLAASEKRNEDLRAEIKTLKTELEETRRGLEASHRMSEQLAHQSETIAQLKAQVFELSEKLREKEDKANEMNLENKVDRQLVTNLLIGYMTAPGEAKGQVLGVLSSVLSLSKEERQKVGLEPGGRQQTLSEAFIKFLQSESQPRQEVILPLGTPANLPPSRKSSLLTTEVPSLPHFSVGRNPGSILKDVLQDRQPE